MNISVLLLNTNNHFLYEMLKNNKQEELNNQL
jgi:hypothetical protein